MSSQLAQRELSRIKEWYYHNYPLCLFCGHYVREGDLAHVIRRSYSTEIMTLKLNTGLAHRECHFIYDDCPGQAVYLPRMPEVMYIVYRLDPQYFFRISEKYPLLFPFFERYQEVNMGEIQHHGEILTLQYLIQ